MRLPFRHEGYEEVPLFLSEAIYFAFIPNRLQPKFLQKAFPFSWIKIGFFKSHLFLFDTPCIECGVALPGLD